MYVFISLREFILLKDPLDHEPKRPLGHIAAANVFLFGSDQSIDIINRYDIAKETWEIYGDAGPPINTQAITMKNGHGGFGGDRRIFKGRYPKSSREFYLTRMYNGEEQSSLINIDTWWAEISTLQIIQSVIPKWR